jgi:hypothetical protein
MTPDQFRAALADLGLSQVGFARLALVDARTVRRWCDGTRAVPGPVVALLGMMTWQPIETAPRDGSPVLVCQQQTPHWYVVRLAYWEIDHTEEPPGWRSQPHPCISFLDELLLWQPTHWAPFIPPYILGKQP